MLSEAITSSYLNCLSIQMCMEIFLVVVNNWNALPMNVVSAPSLKGVLKPNFRPSSFELKKT